MPSKTDTVGDLDEFPLAATRLGDGDRAPAGISLTKRQVLLGDIDMRIDADGQWHYRGSPIPRQALAKLFTTVLRRDTAGDYWLITPAEVARVRVDDAPFVAVGLEIDGSGRDQTLIFRTNMDQNVTLSPDRPLRVEMPDGPDAAPRPYLVVADDGSEALIGRAVYYDLVARAVEHEQPGESLLGAEPLALVTV